jgi:phosphopantothenoylcysteine decarboxylase/phosphopantothenate--cysteine ligase
MMKGKKIILGVTGGIAAYKAAELMRELVRSEAEVFGIMTQNAQAFISPLTFQTLSGHPVATDLFNLIEESEIGHISLADRADLIVIAPATANVIGKIAAGIADDMLTATVMAARAPVLFAPAMNVHMWNNPILQENIKKLKARGYFFIDPEAGELACGYEGTGRLAEIAGIVEEIRHLLAPQDLSGEKILVTAGPTQEAIDPVRFLANRSSGKMGFALARAARRRGADVLLISGPTALSCPRGIHCLPVRSAEEMHQAVLQNLDGKSILIMAAAVADFRPSRFTAGKMKKSQSPLLLELERTPDILAETGKARGNCLRIGFAAETQDLLENARAKLAEKKLDLIVANDVTQPGAGFGGDTNIAKLIDAAGQIEEIPLMTKEQLADVILDRVIGLRKR